MRKTSDIHVSRLAGSAWWKVSHSGKVLSFHHTQATAVKAAIRLARALRATRRRRGVDVVTHGRNGRIRSKDSYGNETGKKDTER